MKYLFLVLLLVACSEKPQDVETHVKNIVTKVEENKPIDPPFQVGNCYRSRSNTYDYYLRVDKKYDETTVNVTIIRNLEYYTAIETLERSHYMEYSCEAFNDMMRTSSAYKEPVEQCEECNCDKEN